MATTKERAAGPPESQFERITSTLLMLLEITNSREALQRSQQTTCVRCRYADPEHTSIIDDLEWHEDYASILTFRIGRAPL
jgi:hypothetical protein